jgi:hypothetical protein
MITEQQRHDLQVAREARRQLIIEIMEQVEFELFHVDYDRFNGKKRNVAVRSILIYLDSLLHE